MSNKMIFDNAWINKSHPESSWANEVIKDYQNTGKAYLQEISDWFINYPGSNKRKNGLKSGVLNSDNFSHLGAVNELSWWSYLRSRDINIFPISEGKKSTPDFEVSLEQNTLIFEVTTINASSKEKCRNLQYSQGNTLYRILNKITDEKLPQFKYGHDRDCPVILVLFNYDEWSGFGTKLSNFVKNYFEKHDVPKELSAILYMERSVIGGKSMYNNNGTSLYLNPNADFCINRSEFESFLELENEWSQCEKA